MEGEVWTGSVVLRTEARPDSCFRRMVRRLAKDFLTDEADRRYYADRYTCCPPPLFVPIITLLEVGVARACRWEMDREGESGGRGGVFL